ncbi:MAG TPA: hypothetical protein DCG19_09895 [Cryomorphaceae bacterium]|nr:hypothetical protein [Owenweeksia sp.]HAD97706.1 hypothetical protein [Cryomorphaceae bacterium]HBF21075.1 hypothetical protein [Cryomorphaceae bacterium]HCQ14821.1 hypothetical protein [Cryomorphaceae bacterium]|tara:strand:+ start:463 stop:1026 length:564 start_codon:yes stop_codon:yes gene_type:complete
MHLKIHNSYIRSLGVLLVLFFLNSCQCSGQEPAKSPRQQRNPSEEHIQHQRDFLKKERESIKAYLKDRKLEVKRSGTGLYYQILQDSSAQEQVATEDEVVFDYSIYMLNGSLLYTSEGNSPRTLVIDREDAEIGLHESLKLLGLGDKGLFILPSHLAFGVAGDQNKVPPKTALVYELKILKITKSKS